MSRSAVRGLAYATLLTLATGWATAASAFEFLDGRLEVHGFYEAQIRGMARDFDLSDGADLTQWYNILNLEIEADFAPDGFGPFDIISGFARLDIRYDCVWSRSCGLFSSADTFGDDANKVPKRLGDGRRAGFRSSGNIFNGDRRAFSDIPRALLPFQFSRYDPANPSAAATSTSQPERPNGSRRPSALFNIQGIDTLYDNSGENGIFGDFDDPAPYYFASQERGCVFNFRKRRGSMDGVGTQIMGPWNPGCKIEPIGALAQLPDPLSVLDTQFGRNRIPGSFGSGALPLRPAALHRAVDPATGAPLPFVNKAESQGVYFPNSELAKMLRNDEFGSFDQNYREEELRWNRGASQQDEKELREAYLDLEMFDSRLWLRLGKQSIVWGKTELFRNQDQWNPQDLALTSLPSLEESRISLWAARGVWSFYDVGPLNDLRLELAATFDQFEPADLGRCGEPYSPNPVCNKTLGLFIHGLTGFGVAGEVRPPDPWNSWQGIEVGGRLEWRWSRFSFALTDYYGFTDFPYQDNIFVYSRNSDPITGRPRKAQSRGGCDPEALRPAGDPLRGDTSACLTTGNALAEHSANQQLFRMICATSIGFTGLDPTACGQSVFNSQTLVAGLPVSDILSRILAGQPGDVGGRGEELLDLLIESLGATSLAVVDGSTYLPQVTAAHVGGLNTPLVPLNKDNTTVDRLNRAPLPANPGLSQQGLARHLTVEQEALLGCGTFYSSNCDSDGLDLMNAEASVLFQSFPGFEGTFGLDWDTTDVGVMQPGTIGFLGGAPCARYEGGQAYVLPGCRGPGDPGYDSMIDGTVSGAAHPWTGQEFKNEMAILSWNTLMGLVGFSAVPGVETIADFDPERPFREDGCSYRKPHLCASVQALFQVTGLQRNGVRAGGTDKFGRRDFVWHGGKDIALRYEKRNILGLSMDFAEDFTKTNWGMEVTWQEGLPFADNNELDGLTTADTYNVTISMDRPTFINFLNEGRTFFINTQWFLQYVDGYQDSFTSNGPFNALGVLAINTGYFEDRLLPRMTLVYDVRSNSGAFIPEITYRFSSDFSVTFGLGFFVGREEPRDMAITPTSLSNRVGRHAYKDFVENAISAARDRDEAFLRVRYAF